MIEQEVNTTANRLAVVSSCILSFLLFAGGAMFLVVPGMVMKFVFGADGDDEKLNLTRLFGGILVSSSFSTVMMMMIAANSKDPPRTALSSHAMTGLILVLVGLWNDRINPNDDLADDIREYEWLLGTGAIFLVLSCIGLMASFWPNVVRDDVGERRPSTNNNDTNRHRGDALATEENTRPLLLENSTPPEGEEAFDDEEVPTPDEPEETTADNSNQQQQSRIQGTLRLIKLAAPQISYLYMGCIVLLIRLPFSLSIPHFISTTLGALTRGDYTAARSEILLLFILGTIDAALDFWCVFLFGYAKERIVRSVRIDTFCAILRQDITFFDHHTSGDLASRLSSDCGEMSGDLTWFFRFSIESVVRITGITVYMLIRCPILGGCALSIVPVVAIVNKVYGNWLRQNAIKVQTALAQANSVAQEALACIRTVIAFAAEDIEQSKYDHKIDYQYRLNIQQLFMTGVYYMFVSTFLINTCVQAALLLIGTALVHQGKLTPEILLAFMLYQGQLQNETMNLFNSYSSLIKSSGAGDKVFQLLDRIPPPPGTGNPQVAEGRRTTITTSASTAGADSSSSSSSSSTSVQLNNVSFCYPTRPTHTVLNGLNLEIPAGSTVALVGPSGEFKNDKGRVR